MWAGRAARLLRGVRRVGLEFFIACECRHKAGKSVIALWKVWKVWKLLFGG
jgi:hypothetical protein